MDVPPVISFRHRDANEELKERILEKIEKLEDIHDRMVSCRVTVEEEGGSEAPGGALTRVRIEIGVPHHQIVISRDPGEEGAGRTLTQAINDAFARASRRLKEVKERQRREVKTRDLPPHGRVTRLLSDATGVRYGFLMSRDGREIYFHENSLVELDYDELEVGTEVRYAERDGNEGPRASTVAPLDRGKLGPRESKGIPLQDQPGT
jgi:ribosome-associated translation inhibitor RaiA/cold shock CspA family protein